MTPCNCRYMKAKNWGYHIAVFIGGRRYWRAVGNAKNLDEVREIIAPIATVLVRCNGCGSDILREYPKP